MILQCMQVYSAVNESVLGDAVVLPVMCSSDGGHCSDTHLVSNLSLSSQSYNISVSGSNTFGSSGPSTVFTIPGDHICSDSSDSSGSDGRSLLSMYYCSLVNMSLMLVGSIVPLIVLGASVGGLILLLGVLCVIAVTCVVRGRNNTSESLKENFKSRELLAPCRCPLFVLSSFSFVSSDLYANYSCNSGPEATYCEQYTPVT